MMTRELIMKEQVKLLREAVRAEIDWALGVDLADERAKYAWKAFEEFSLKHTKAKHFDLEKVVERALRTKGALKKDLTREEIYGDTK